MLELEPLVKESTKTEGTNIAVLLTLLRKDNDYPPQAYIPDYQRDCNEWGDIKKSRFIESILNNLTTPAIFLCEDDQGRYEVVDGQQRLNTILEYSNDKFAMVSDNSVDYLTPQSVYYKGKRFSELDKKLKKIFNFYSIAVIYLPPKMDLTTKLEIFRRINEGGTPLTGQDIRLSYYSTSRSVTGIRLAGIYHGVRLSADGSDEAWETDDSNGDDDEQGAAPESINPVSQMLERARLIGVPFPWDRHNESYDLWRRWWGGKNKARGQTPSLGYLWYLVSRSYKELHQLLDGNISHLRLSFNDNIDTALDIFCAQLRFQDVTPPDAFGHALPCFEDIVGPLFDDFAIWIGAMLGRGAVGLGPDKFKQIMLFIGAAAAQGLRPDDFNNAQWTVLSRFLSHTRQNANLILDDAVKFPEPKGRWGLHSERGQFAQCEIMHQIAARLREYHG